MSDMTVADALLIAPSSADKTAIDAAADTMVAALDTAVTNETLLDESRIQLKADFIDWLENVASNLMA